MQISNTLNNIIRILFNPKVEAFKLFDFLVVKSDEDRYIAQIIEIYDDKFDASQNVARLKLFYKITKDNNEATENIETHEFRSSININEIRSEYDVIIDYHRIILEKNSDGSSAPLHLIPRTLIVGIGCKRGTSKEAIAAAYMKLLKSNNIDNKAICGFASIDLKSNEQGLLDFAAEEGIDISFYTTDEPNSVEGDYTGSDFVQKVTGTDNICERSAVFHGEKGSSIIVKKTRFDGITMAIAEKVPDPLIIKK